MKNLLTTSALLISVFLTGCAETPALPESTQGFDVVVDAQGRTKDQIYISTKTWLAETFNSAKAVIQIDSKEDGLIVGNGIIAYPCGSAMDCLGTSDWKVPFTIRIEMKDQKFKMTFSNVMLTLPANPGLYTSTTTTIKQQKDMDKIKPALLNFSNKLLAEINKNKVKSNW